MLLLRQLCDIIGVEAYLKACEGPLFINYGYTNLMVAYEDTPDGGFIAWTEETETSPDDTGWSTLQEAIDNPIDNPINRKPK